MIQQIKNYLLTFKPNSFEKTTRLIASLIFLICMVWFFYAMYLVVGHANDIESLKNNYILFPLSLALGILFYLSVDNTGGFGRNYLNKKGWRNFLLIYPIWIAYFVLHWVFFVIMV